MPLKLILLRHAKSGWNDMTLADHDRVLADRGEAAALRFGTWLEANDHLPDMILCSDAVRTRQTVDGLVASLRQSAPIQDIRALYLAGPDTLLRHIGKQTAGTLLVCAHNPGIGALAQQLVDSPPDHARFADYPTAAATVINFDTDQWSDIKRGTCIAFITPADLK